jgi:hypothetical protein
MPETLPTGAIACPKCERLLDGSATQRVQCPACAWVGDVVAFSPKALEIEPAKPAMPEDAACNHHQRKKAVAVCAGTGDYICSLCAIELNGQTYSAEFLNGPGKDITGKAFEINLPRPDSQIRTYIVCCFIPYINAIFVVFAFIWIPHAFFLYARALKLKRENELFRRVFGTASMILLPIALVVIGLGWITMVVAIVFAIARNGRY